MAEYVEPGPDACPACGKRYRPQRVLVSFLPCDCPGAENGGHIAYGCLATRGGCGHLHREGHVGPAPEVDVLPDFGQA